MAVQQIKDRSASEAENLARSKKSPQEDGPREGSPYLATLRATALLAPVVAVLGTLSSYVVSGGTFESYPITAGAFAVIAGASAAVFVWLVVALLLRRFTGADSVNRRSYDLLCERLCQLENRVEHARLGAFEPQEEIGNGIYGSSHGIAFGHAARECEEIKRRLESGGGMPWVTGMGYVGLWRRLHRAEEALIKLEPCTETLAGAMYDESRLKNSNMTNKDPLLKRLRSAVVVLDGSETGELQYLEEQPECSLDKKQREKPKNRAKATAILSEVRHEINSFRDNVWEGIAHARNRLAGTSVLLGLVTYALLALAVFAGASHTAIIWAFAYFLVGALAGLFAQARTERTMDTAVDDFGLSTARLLNIPWLSGLAAVGGVLIASILDGQFTTGNLGGDTTLTNIFAGGTSSVPSLLIVAAVFGATPDLIIQRLTQQAERYKGDLQSTETSQSTEAGRSNGTEKRG